MNASSLMHAHAERLAPSPFAEAMLDGLLRQPKQTSPKWLYDARGSDLFEQITDLPEYYPTRTEIALLKRHLHEMVDGLPQGLVVIELGSGSSRKTPLLLSALPRPAAYVPIDISESALQGACAGLHAQYRELALWPVRADFTEVVALPPHLARDARPRLGFFPGSTLGNFTPDEACELLVRYRRLLGPGSRLLLGLDTVKDIGTLLRAYDDAAGITAEFNLNLLARLSGELGARIDPMAFEHEARWNASTNAIEMHLVSRRVQHIMLLGERIGFQAGESIHTESSFKYSPAAAWALFQRAGWQVDGTWLAPCDAFAFYRLSATEDAA